MDKSTTIPDAAMNTNKCEDEQIHLIESVQTFGYLLAVDPVSCQVKVTSENLSDILASPVFPGQSCFTEIVEMPDNAQEILSSLYEQARSTARRHSYEWTFKNKIYKDYAGEVIGEDCHEELVPFKG